MGSRLCIPALITRGMRGIARQRQRQAFHGTAGGLTTRNLSLAVVAGVHRLVRMGEP